jgi:hypothetical protein
MTCGIAGRGSGVPAAGHRRDGGQRRAAMDAPRGGQRAAQRQREERARGGAHGAQATTAGRGPGTRVSEDGGEPGRHGVVVRPASWCGPA